MPRMSAGQHGALQMLCEDIAQQLDWPAGSGERIGPTAWRDLLVAAYDRAHGRGTRLLPAIDGAGFDVVRRKVSRFNKLEGSEIIEFAAAWGAERGVKFRERKAKVEPCPF